jgi:hypothetical protein
MMKVLIIGGLVFVLLMVAALILRTRRGVGTEVWPFVAKKALTEPEQILYFRLVKALPDCMVLAQVQLSRVLGVAKGANFGQWNNRINRLSLDYLVCLKDSTAVAAIELDDSSHNRTDRKEADARKAKALASAGVPLLRWSVSALPTEEAIRNAIAR